MRTVVVLNWSWERLCTERRKLLMRKSVSTLSLRIVTAARLN
jgi:hypothetical protein